MTAKDQAAEKTRDQPAPLEHSSDSRSVSIEALREIDTTSRVNLRLLGGMMLAVALLMQISRYKHHTWHWVATGLLLMTSAYAWGVHFKVARDREIQPHHVLVAGMLCTCAVLASMVYLSPISSVAGALTALVFGWSLGASRLSAWGVYLTASIGFGVVVGLTLAGVFRLTGFVVALSQENSRALVGLSVMIEILLGSTFFLGRRMRDSLDTQMERAERAQLELNRRGALLDEARAELRSILVGGKLGPHSGRDAGPYRVEDVIGRGGMGEIYRAIHRGTGEVGAVKVLHAAALEDSGNVERFLRELDVSRKLQSPHIVKVFESGVLGDGSPYLVMELLDGIDLGRRLQKEKRMTPEETVELVNQLAAALSVAEKASVVHRDIKPQNVFRTELGGKPVWKLLDFGVSKLRESSGTLTQGAAVGTPSYMSPEQVRGLSVDHRADVFSLAAIAYRALTGRPAFSGPDHLAIMYKVHQQQPTQPSALGSFHFDVELVLALGLAKDRTRRFKSGLELARALAAAVHGKLPDELRERARTLLAEAPWANAVADDVTIDES